MWRGWFTWLHQLSLPPPPTFPPPSLLMLSPLLNTADARTLYWCYCQNRAMGKHMRSTIEFSQPTACMQWLFQSRTEENHHKSRGKRKRSCWMWLLGAFFNDWKRVMCAVFFFFGSLNKQLQKNNPALAYFRAVYTKRHKAIKYKEVFKKTTATIKRRTDFGINVHPLSSSNKQ